MKKFIEKCKKWLSKKPWYWSAGFMFVVFFMLGLAFITIIAIIASMLQWLGTYNALGAFVDEKLASSEFYSSKEFFAVYVYGIAVFSTAIILISWQYKAGNKMYYATTWPKQKEKRETFAEKNIDAPIRKFYMWLVCFASRPSGIATLLLLGITLIAIFYEYISTTLGISGDSNANNSPKDIYRNRIFVIGAFVTFFLTIWGRWIAQKQTKQTQEQIELSKKANTSARYENAARMLGDDVLSVRIAGCQALKSLGEENEKIGFQCVQLLMLFIKKPYIDKEKKTITQNFVDEKALKLELDVKAAIIGLNSICRYYYDKGQTLELGAVDLPNYFWKNGEAEPVVLPKANLLNANLQGASLEFANLAEANLSSANLSSAHLSNSNFQDAILLDVDFKDSDLIGARFQGAYMRYANFSKANLIMVDFSDALFSETNLSGANISGAKMKTAKRLKKEQVLSARWIFTTVGNSDEEEPFHPQLPDELLQDKDIQNWLKDPNYAKKQV